MAYSKLLNKNISKYIDFIFKFATINVENSKLYFYGDDFGNPIISVNNIGYDNIRDNGYEFNGLRLLIINLESQLYDVVVNMALELDLNNSVITISTSEGFLRSFDIKKPIDKNRIRAFFKICKEFCEEFKPEFISITDEAFIPAEFTVDVIKNKINYKYDSNISFDENKVESLYFYYKRPKE